MTNFDLEEVYDFLSYIRYDPSNQKNIVLLNRLIDLVNETNKNSIAFREVFYSKENENYVRKVHTILPEYSQKTVIEDVAVYTFFRYYFLEIKNLCLTQRYNQVFYLIDKLDNFPEEIVKNKLFLPIRKLKKCLSPYWRKYDRSFLRDFIREHLSVTIS